MSKCATCGKMYEGHNFFVCDDCKIKIQQLRARKKLIRQYMSDTISDFQFYSEMALTYPEGHNQREYLINKHKWSLELRENKTNLGYVEWMKVGQCSIVI